MLLEKPGRLCYEFDLDYYQKLLQSITWITSIDRNVV